MTAELPCGRDARPGAHVERIVEHVDRARQRSQMASSHGEGPWVIVTTCSDLFCQTLAMKRSGTAWLLAVVLVVSACGSSGGDAGSTEKAKSTGKLDRVVKVEGARGLYVRCTGSGSPTVFMEGGDEDTSDSYGYAEEPVAKVTRTCVYDRANLGRSDPREGPLGLDEYVGDVEALLEKAKIPGPYVLVGTSGGGYLSVGYAVKHPDQVAGIVLVETGPPFRNPPKEIVEATDPSNPENVERRDYLQIEKDGWAAKKEIGDIPVTVISNRFSKVEIDAAEFPEERPGMRTNVENQKGWLVLSPLAKQVVVTTGHAVEEKDPQLVVNQILAVVKSASSGPK
jgi:pimeloyl-ACP methyl ester carboxylesterase